MTDETGSLGQGIRTSRNRREFLRSLTVIGGAAIGGSLLAACQAATPSAPKPTAAPPPAAQPQPTSVPVQPAAPQPTTPAAAATTAPATPQPASITVTMLPGVLEPLVRPFLADLKKDQNVDVELALLPFAELRSKVLTELVAKTGRYDVVLVSEAWIPEFADHLTPITPYLQDPKLADPTYDFKDLIPASVAGGTYKGNQIGIPWRDSARMLFWNKKMLEDAGFKAPPANWDEALSMAKVLTKGNQWGLAVQGEPGWQAAIEFHSNLLSWGETMLDSESKKATFNSAKGVDALQFYVDLVRTHKVSPPASVAWGYEPVITAMQQGTVAMSVLYSPYAAMMDDPTKSKVVGQIEYAPAPKKEKSSTIGAAWQYSIPKDAKNKEAAFRFIQYMTTKRVQLEATKLGNLPVRYSVFQDPELNSKRRDFKASLEALASSSRLPAVQQTTEVMDIFGKSVNESLTGAKAPKEALDAAAERVNNLLKA